MANIDPKAFDGIPLSIVALPLKGSPGKQGDPGKTGLPGKSNYQLWLEAGNTGTIEDFLATTKGEKGDTGAGLINRGEWTIGTYQPGEFVGSFKSASDTSKVVYVLIGGEEYISTLPPYSDPTHWMMLDIKAGFEDAPMDGKQYARKDGAWAEVKSAGDVARQLTLITDQTVNPDTKYKEWETEYGFATDSSDWDARWNVDDIAAVAYSGALAGSSAPAISISSEGQVCWDYSASPSGGSVQVTLPNISRAYWNIGPRPWSLMSFHPVDGDCEGVGMLGHAIRGVGLIFKGMIRIRSTQNSVSFAMRFIGGSYELYLRVNGTAPVDFVQFAVTGGEVTQTFTPVKPNHRIPAAGFLQAHWQPIP